MKGVVPEGIEKYREYVKSFVEKNPDVMTKGREELAVEGIEYQGKNIDGEHFLITTVGEEYDEIETEWDGEEESVELEGTRTAAERKGHETLGDKRRPSGLSSLKLYPEPPLTADQYVFIGSMRSTVLTRVQN